MEIGPDLLGYGLLDESSRQFFELGYFTTEEAELQPSIDRLLLEWKDRSFSRVVVSPAFPAALLVPAASPAQGDVLLQTIYSQPQYRYFTDTVPQWQLRNAYGMPAAAWQQLQAAFPGLTTVHAYTPPLQQYNGFDAADQMMIHFSPGTFRVIVKSGGAIRLAQTYPYKTPLDVVYYLLKICAEMECGQGHVFLVLSGLVHEDSALYKEIRHYFTEVHFTVSGQQSIGNGEYPPHYFASLYNLAACVS